MDLSIKITNSRCVHNCVYCYERALRRAPLVQQERPLDVDGIIRQIRKEQEIARKLGQDIPGIYLHGGEALSAGHEVVEKLLRLGWETKGYTGIQTYGLLIDDRYISMFKRYNTSVGVSIDGPYPLNRARVTPGVHTKEATERVMKNIAKMRAQGITVSIICILTRVNALPEPRAKLKEWLLELADMGVVSVRLNLMETDLPEDAKSIELTEEEAEDAWRDLTRFFLYEAPPGVMWQPMMDAVSSLLGLESGTCVFGACAYYHAKSESVILSDGATANCLHTAKTGHMYPRDQYDGDHKGFGGVRYDVLPRVPWEHGGCVFTDKNNNKVLCRYWRNCMGGCPSEGINGDWRNRTRFCRAYYGLFEEVERHLRKIMPNIRLTTDPDRRFPGDGPWGMDPPAFQYMLRQYTERPSSWRGEALRHAIQVTRASVRDESSGWVSPIEHRDGAMVHLDSNLAQNQNEHHDGIKHVDGSLVHLDSDLQPFVDEQVTPPWKKEG